MIFNRNSDEQITSSAKKDIKDIDHRVTEFSRWLQKLSKPSLITVCRSRYSHFSPADQWAYMEKKLLEKLQSLYTLDVRSIHEIVESY
jgi:hypothetical protein